MERRFTLIPLLVLLMCPLRGGEIDPLFRSWAEKQKQGDSLGALKELLAVLKDHPGNPGALQRMGITSRAIDQKAQKIERLSRKDRSSAVARAAQMIRQRDRETREAMNNLRASYEHNWKTTPEALLHTCRGVDLQIQITLPDDAGGRRMKDYLSSLCLSLAEASKRGTLPDEANVHRVAGFLAFQRLELEGAISEWRKAHALVPDDTVLADFVSRTEEISAKEKQRAQSQEKTALATQRLAKGQTKSALVLFKEAAQLDPGNIYAAEQAQRLERLLSRENSQTALGRHRGRAMEFEANGKRSDAVREWMAVLEVDPLNTEARERVEKLVTQSPPLKPPPVSKDSTAQRRDPDQAAGLYSQGLLLYAEDKVSEARKAFEECVRLDPSHQLARRAIERISRQISQKK